MASRRRVDWHHPGPQRTRANGREPAGPRRTGGLLSAFEELLALDDTDAILRRAVELARERIGFARAGIFLFNQNHNRMMGTWE